LNTYCLALSRYLYVRDESGLPASYAGVRSLVGYADWLRTHAWIDLEPIDTAERGVRPHGWYFDDRQGDPSDEWPLGNNMPVISNWFLLSAYAIAYAYRHSGSPEYMESATRLFRTGSCDPWFEETTISITNPRRRPIASPLIMSFSMSGRIDRDAR
jgi:hypothetical protein